MALKQERVEQENPTRVVWALAGPAVVLNTLQTVNALLDSYFVQHLPTSNLTAIGAATNVIFLFISMSFAMGVASTALVSRSFGAKDPAGYQSASQRSLALSVWIGVAFALVCWPGASLAASLLLPVEAVDARRQMTTFLVAFGFGLPAYFVIQSLAGSLRGIGDTRSPMTISGLQIVLHILLNFLLINPPRPTPFGIVMPGAGLGLLGAGIAMTVSAWTAAVIYMVWSRTTPLRLSWNLGWVGLQWARRILNVAVPAAMMAIVRVTSLMAFTGVLKQVPQAEVAIAAIRPAFSIESLTFMPAFGLSVAASALIGQSLGMGRPDRAERLGWIAAHQAALISLVASVALLFLAHPVAVLLLPSQPEVAEVAARFLFILCLTEFLFAYGMVFTGAMQGAGDTARPFWMTLACMWGVRVPLAAWLALPSFGPVAGLALGADGCWIAMSVTQALQGFAALVLFKAGHWKHQQV
ncbi:MAG: MATE family efflux transporter [Fimbriimonadaceae bacterium]|nr:MATE family efflux transporter [Fimbriimonadaceae bacterium]QYK57262.1 MAG: MATE family efflux transporter [Fimbriimonadaceae bacterium]